MNQVEQLSINQTPVRTSQNFRINDMKLKEFTMPTITPFQSVTIDAKEAFYERKRRDEFSLSYGMGHLFLQQSREEENVAITITVPKGMESDCPMIVNFVFDEVNATLVDVIEIIAEADSRAQIVLNYVTADGLEQNIIPVYRNSILTGRVEARANLNVTVVNHLPQNADSFYSNELCVEEEGVLTTNFVDFGSHYSIVNMVTTLDGVKAQSHSNLLYMGAKKNILDYNVMTILKASQSVGRIEAQGVVDDQASKSFKGTLDFKRGATQSVGHEHEYCMMLSDTPTSISLPMLLCEEEEVEGTHSCASGKVDEKVMFYLQTRGFSEEEARRLMIKANFYAILQQVLCRKTRAQIIHDIDERIV